MAVNSFAISRALTNTLSYNIGISRSIAKLYLLYNSKKYSIANKYLKMEVRALQQ